MSDTSVDITGWSIGYFSSTATAISLPSQLVKFSSSDPTVHLVLDPNTREAIVSKDYAAAYAVDLSAFQFSSTLTYDKSAVELIDASGSPIDLVGWGTNARYEGSPAKIMSVTSNLIRSSGDTNNNSADFDLAQQQGLQYTYGHISEVEDACLNIDGIQEIVPSGMVASSGNCAVPDVCPNIDGPQATMPEGDELRNGSCLPIFIAQPLQITELLPNPAGVDGGHEYIEVYNPTDEAVNLSDYLLESGGVRYAFPEGLSIDSLSYYSFDPLGIELVLPNSVGREVSLVGVNGEIVSNSPAYESAPIDESWSLIADSWQFTNQLTPGTENMPSILDEVVPGQGSILAPCADGWYRSVDTGRCRKIQVAATVVPCNDGQYRSEETGRCRSIATAAAAVLKPCADDQFRNPDTGRCKQIASTEDVVQPCDSGYERNPDTNRCRKVVTAAMPLAAFPVQPIVQTQGDSAGTIALAAVATIAVGYIVWEWRREIVRILRTAVGFLARSK
jgi:hypothetical protein